MQKKLICEKTDFLIRLAVVGVAEKLPCYHALPIFKQQLFFYSQPSYQFVPSQMFFIFFFSTSRSTRFFLLSGLLAFFSAPTGFHDWGSVARWAVVLLNGHLAPDYYCHIIITL